MNGMALRLILLFSENEGNVVPPRPPLFIERMAWCSPLTEFGWGSRGFAPDPHPNFFTPVKTPKNFKRTNVYLVANIIPIIFTFSPVGAAFSAETMVH